MSTIFAGIEEGHAWKRGWRARRYGRWKPEQATIAAIGNRSGSKLVEIF